MTFPFLRTQATPEPSTSGHHGIATQPDCHSRCMRHPGVMQESSPFSFHSNFRPRLLHSRWALESPSFPPPTLVFSSLKALLVLFVFLGFLCLNSPASFPLTPSGAAFPSSQSLAKVCPSRSRQETREPWILCGDKKGSLRRTAVWPGSTMTTALGGKNGAAIVTKGCLPHSGLHEDLLQFS